MTALPPEPDRSRHAAAERFSELFAGFQGGIVVASADGSVIAADARFSEMVGLPADDILGAEPPYPWWPLDQRPWFAAQLGELLGSAVHRGKFEGEFVDAVGDRFGVVCSVTGVDGLDGERIIMVVRRAADLDAAMRVLVAEKTEPPRAEHDLATALRRLFDSNIVGVITGEGDRVLTANDAFLDMLGYTQDDLASGGIGWPALTPPEWLEADARAGEQMLRAGSSDPIEKQYMHRDGRRVWVRIAGAVVSWQPFRWVSLVEDITAQRRAEEKRAAAERYLLQRTEALAAANALLDRLAQRVAHDLANPITSLSGLVEVLDQQLDPEEESQVRKGIRTSLEGLREQVRELQHITRGSAIEVFREEVSLDELVGSISRLVDPLLRESEGRLAWNELPVVVGSRAGLLSVLQNLIINAIVHHDPARPPVIEVTVEPNGDGWLIAVTDNGPGVPEEERSTIFEHGVLGAAPQPGSGIGLAVVRTIVEAHGGRIWVEDGPSGQGARFVFSLPFVENA